MLSSFTLGEVKNPYCNRYASRQAGLRVGYALMLNPDQIRLLHRGNVKREFALGIGFGFGHVFHAIADLLQCDFVPGGRLVGGAVLDDALQRLCRGNNRADEEQ